jgi:cytochrome c oxidase assembly protein subunit 15
MATQTEIRIQAPHSTTAASRFAWGVLAFMVLVVLWGAVVRATSSGAGCGANWPLCNGDFVPHHPRLATVIEFTHRSMSGICTFSVIAMIAWTFHATRPGHIARKAAVWSGVLLVTEAFLGAVLVLRHYVENNISAARTVAQAVHLTNTLLLLAAITLTAWFLRRQRIVIPPPQNLHSLSVLTIISTLIVAATGGLAALADTLFPSTSLAAGMAQDFAASAPTLVRMRWIHPAATLIAFICVILLAERLRTRLGKTVLALMILQAVLGVADVLLLAPTWMQVVHLLGADIFWIAMVCLAADVLWPPQPIQTISA